MHRFWPWLLDRPIWTLAVLTLATALFLSHFNRLQFDTSPSTLILAGSRENRYYETITQIFGSDQVLLVGLSGDDMLQRSQLENLRTLTGELQGIFGVKRVLSLTNIADVKGTNDEVLVSPLVPEDLRTFDPQTIRSRLKINPFYIKNLISSDFRTTCIVVFLENFENREAQAQRRQVALQVRATAHRLGSNNEVFIGGLPEMELEGTERMIRDLKVFTPVTLLLVVTVLLISFRCLRGMFLPLVVVAVTLIWTLGAMAWGGHPLQVSTLVLPSLLIANGGSYTVHFLAQYYRALLRAYGREPDATQLSRGSCRAILLDTLNHSHTPIFISAATTMSGFGALGLSQIPAIRDLGIFATLGIFLSYSFCVTLVPCLLMLSPVPCLAAVPGKEGSHRYLFLERLGNFDIRHRGWIYGLFLVATFWAVWGAFQVGVHTDYLRYFRSSAPVVHAAEKFHQRLAGIVPLSVIVETSGQRKVTDPEVLRSVEALQRSMSAAPGVDTTLSFVDTLKLLNSAFHAEDPHYFTLPSDPTVIQDLIDFAESDPSGLNEQFLSADHQHLRIFARTHLFSSSEFSRELNQIRLQARALFPPDLQVHATGELVLMNQTSDRVASEQVKTLVVSVLLIVSIVIFLFRSWKIGLLAMIPVGIPVLLFFGLMGWGHVDLNVNTSVIASIALGITVDNCVHYLAHFRRNFRSGFSIPDSARQSLMSAGGPMITAATARTLGFLVFGLSSFRPVSNFGLLSGFIMVVNLIADLFLLPTLMLLTGRKTVEEIPTEEE
jgi:uncharacterized protein